MVKNDLAMTRSDTQARLTKMTMLLARRPGYSAVQLSQLLEVDIRTIYRYLERLEELGFSLDLDMKKRHFLSGGSLDQGLCLKLEPEELAYLWDLLQEPGTSHVMARDLRRRMESVVRPHAVLEQQQAPTSLSRMLHLVRDALSEKTSLRLIQYRSNHSNQISDRLLQPLYLSDAGCYLIAYEPASDTVKQFKLTRAERIESCPQPITYMGDFVMVDLFGMSGPTVTQVVIDCTQRAANLFLEEYYGAERFLTRQEEAVFFYRIDIPVRSWVGIGRFLLGLPGEARVRQPAALLAYLEERRKVGWG